MGVIFFMGSVVLANSGDGETSRRTVFRHIEGVRFARFSPDGTKIVAPDGSNAVRIWDAATGRPLSSPLRHEDWITGAVFSPDGKKLVTTGFDCTARFWDVETGRELGAPLWHGTNVEGATFSPDGAKLVTTSGVAARIWDAETGKLISSPVANSLTEAKVLRMMG